MGGMGQPTVAMVNSALADSDITAALADSKTDLQNIVAAYTAILAEANGAAADATPAADPTQPQNAAIGDSVAEGPATTLLGDVIGNQLPGGVDTVQKIQGLANLVAKAQAGQASAQELADLGLDVSDMNADNQAWVQATLHAATQDSGDNVDSLSDLQALIDQATDAFGQISSKIQNYAADDGAAAQNNASLAPTGLDYTAMGVTGIGAEGNTDGQPTVAMVNSALADSDITADLADS
jgi:hypothetical protein